MSLKAITFSLALSTVALLAAAPASADQLADIMSRKELRCGTFADVPPFAAPDTKTREMVGFDVGLCNGIAKRWGRYGEGDAAFSGGARARGEARARRS